jgi:hypothetical protein
MAPKFYIELDGKTMGCGSENSVNTSCSKRLQRTINGKHVYQCTGKGLVIGTKKKCDIFSTIPDCEKLHREYKDNQQIYLSVIQKLLNDNEANLSYWTLNKLKERIKNFSTADLLSIFDPMAAELKGREEHLRKCVCVMDTGHMKRIDSLTEILMGIVNTFVERYKVTAQPQPLMDDINNLLLSSQQIGGLHLASKGTASPVVKDTGDALERMTYTVWQKYAKNRVVLENAKISFDDIGSWGWMAKEWKKGLGLAKVFTNVKSLIKVALIQRETFFDGVGCIRFKNGEIFDIKLDPDALSQKLLEKLDITISPFFIVKQPHPSDLQIVETCVSSFYEAQESRRKELCSLLTKIKPEIAAILEPFCSGGDGGTAKEKIRSQIAWMQPARVQMLIRKAGGKTTGNIEVDISNLTLKQAKKLALLFEKEIDEEQYIRKWSPSLLK